MADFESLEGIIIPSSVTSQKDESEQAPQKNLFSALASAFKKQK